MSINPSTNTPSGGTKMDDGMNLAGNQHVSQGLVHVPEHLPYSPAQGAPLHDQPFSEGEGWSQVKGYINPGSGPGNLNW